MRTHNLSRASRDAKSKNKRQQQVGAKRKVERMQPLGVINSNDARVRKYQRKKQRSLAKNSNVEPIKAEQQVDESFKVMMEFIEEEYFDGMKLKLGKNLMGCSDSVRRRVLIKMVEKKQAKAIWKNPGKIVGRKIAHLMQRNMSKCISFVF